jgi:hypothetical protein
MEMFEEPLDIAIDRLDPQMVISFDFGPERSVKHDGNYALIARAAFSDCELLSHEGKDQSPAKRRTLSLAGTLVHSISCSAR